MSQSDPRSSADELRRRAYELSLDLIGACGVDGRLREMNPAWEAALGFTREELLEMPLWDLLHPDDRERASTAMGELHAERSSVPHQSRLRRRDGSYVWIEWSQTPLAEEGLIFLMGRDIGARKRTEDELRESEARLRSLLQSIPAIVMTLDLDYRIQSINRLGSALKEAQVIGVSALKFAPPEHIELSRRALEHVVRTGTPTSYEAEAISSPTARSWYAAYVGPIIKDGQVTALTLVTDDITERKRMEEQLRESVERLRAYSDQLEQANLRLVTENEERGRAHAQIVRQEASLRAMATPIIKAWEGVLVLPIIGAVDGARAAQMMEALLAAIVESRARFAVLDLTGLEATSRDTVAHLLRVVRAAGLLGSRCLISGVSPVIAQSIAAMETDTTALATFGELSDALKYAVLRAGSGPDGVAR